MKKSLAAFACALVGTSAQSLTPPEMAQADVVNLYAAVGDSIAWTFGGGLLKWCDGSTASLYRSSPGTASAWDSQIFREMHSAISCRVVADAPAPLTRFAGKKVALYISSERGNGGAAMQGLGLHPVSQDLRFLAATGCTVVTQPGLVREYACSGIQQRRPMFGVGEVTPDFMNGLDVHADDASYAGVFSGWSQIDVTMQPFVQRLFGIAVNPALYRAMQAAQGLPQDDDASNRPSISSTLAATYFDGQMSSPAEGWGWQHLVGAAHPMGASQVNVCRPKAGSGVMSAVRARLLDGCSANRRYVIDTSFNEIGFSGLAGIASNRQIHVVQGASESGVEQCLGETESRGAFAIGALSIGRYATDLAAEVWTHRFLKIDGAEPISAKAKLGQYPLIADLQMYWNNDSVNQLAPAVQEFIRGYAQFYGSPSTNPWGLPWSVGFLAMPIYGTYAGGSAASMQSTAATMQTSTCNPRFIAAQAPQDLPTGNGASARTALDQAREVAPALSLPSPRTPARPATRQ